MGLSFALENPRCDYYMQLRLNTIHVQSKFRALNANYYMGNDNSQKQPNQVNCRRYEKARAI